jgi:general secretion pathway protein F
MGAYEFTALDEKGRQKKGTLEGDTSRHVRQKLREKGWMPVQVVEVADNTRRKGSFGISFRRKISTKDLALVTRQMATLVSAALPIEEALRTTAQQTEKAHVRRILIAVRSKVMEGHSLADGLSDFPNVFPDLYQATVRAGEQTGHLDVVLERLADYVESRQMVQQKVTQAMVYPIALIIIAITVVVGLLTYVVPEIVGVFESTGQPLPALTRVMIRTSDFLREYGIYLFLGIVALVVGFRWSMRKETFRYRVHQFYLRLPMLGNLIRGINTSQFARTFSILTGSGVPILEGLKISASVIGNLPMRVAVVEAASRIREGAGISRSLENSRQFPPITVNLIASGESSGKLETMLDRAAVSQEREIQGVIGTTLALLEPLLIVVMGGVVMVIVLAILMPIFQMNQLVK